MHFDEKNLKNLILNNVQGTYIFFWTHTYWSSIRNAMVGEINYMPII